ncbi:MAG: hypothetical protein VB035_00795 [Candidatus Fimivivens sp.]|nr:hypothetical protein [Candidatus Fimivivens sp.]
MAFYAHLALQNHNILPSDFMAMPLKDRAFLIASDLLKARAAEEQMKRLRG